MKTYRCPKCGEVIRIEDLEAVEDDGRNDAALLSAPPPAHLAVKTDNDDIWPVTTIRFKRISPLALFFIPFTCIWSGGSLTGIYGSQFMQHSFDLQRSLFGIPFLIGTAVLLSASLFMLFGKRVLTLSHGRGTYFTGVGFIGWTKRFAYGYRTKVEEVESVHHVRNGTSIFRRLRLSSEGAADDVYICSGFSKDALAYTAAVLRRECRSA